MITVLVCDGNQEERILIGNDCREQVAAHCAEDLRFHSVSDDEALTHTAESEELINLLYYGFQKGQSVQALRDFRRQYGASMLMLITDSTVSPLEYLKPGIAPDSLLLRPLDARRLNETNREFIASFLERFQEAETQERFVAETREGRALIPWPRIYYFEARDKKIYVRTRNEEYAFYDTIDALAARVPDTFQRCHRSYIVNTGKIVRIMLSENYLELPNGIGVPVSRSYRARFRTLTEKTEAAE